MNTDLTGKTALVGGSSQGIGKACAMELAALGANVILLARNEEKLRTAMSDLDTSAGQNHAYITADYSNPESVKEAVNGLLVQDQVVHILVNNTGGPPAGPAFSAEPEEFRNAFNNHLVNNHNLVQLLVPGMKSAGYGRVINIISTSVKVPLRGLGVSNTIRGAVANWSKTLSLELAEYGITVNNVLPGATQTERLATIIAGKAEKTGHSEAHVRDEMLAEIPAKRFGLPEEIAQAVAFLAAPAAAYINGINVPVDGGRTGSL